MVLADSHGISRVPRYSGTYPASQEHFAYGVVTLYDQPFQAVRLCFWLVTRRPCGLAGPTTPSCKHEGLGYIRVRSPLLAESLLFSLPVGTEMFHFPTFPPNALCVQAPVTGHDSSWVSPFGHPRITARLSTSRGLSQTPTSFFGS